MAIGEFYVPDADTIRDGILRTQRLGLIARGVANPNVAEGSDLYVFAQATANELEPLYANQLVQAEQFMPDTATGANLDRWLTIVGLSRRPAIGSSGRIVFDTAATGTTFIATGAGLIDGAGNAFHVVTGGVYANGDEIEVQCDATGTTTNHGQNDVLQWVAPPLFANQKVLVAAGGLTGGSPGELTDDELPRARLLTRLQNPPSGGNWAEVAQWAEEGSSSVQKAFVYPALKGPATYAVAIVGSMTAGSLGTQTRGLSAAVKQTVSDYIVSKMPAHADLSIDVAADVLTDVAIKLSLPAATTASPPGPGGGWTDGVPWPPLLGTATRVTVESVVSPTRFVLTSNDAASCPTSAGLTAGTTKIAWLDPLTLTMRVATVSAVNATTTGHVDVTIDSSAPFNGIAAGHYVCPAAERIDVYAQAFIGAMAKFGPGEWTADTNRLPRSARRPLPSIEWPSSLTSRELKAVIDTGPEVLDAAYAYPTSATPAVPGALTSPPNVLVPRHFAAYPL